MFLGPAGCGKTTMAVLIARSLFRENWNRYMKEFNSSDDRGIDVVRNEIKTLSKIKNSKIVLLDEADNQTTDAQQALRRIMELTRRTIFILTGNDENGFITPIRSRCVIFRFRRLKDEEVLKRVLEICKAEEIKLDIKARPAIMRLVQNANGDLRSVLNDLEKLIDEKKEISEKSVIEMEKPKMAVEAMNLALNGNFEEARKKIEDVYIMGGFQVEDIIKEMFNGIKDIKEEKIRIKLFILVARAEMNIKGGGNPIIQLVSLIADIWVVSHVPESCPVGR